MFLIYILMVVIINGELGIDIKDLVRDRNIFYL